MANENPEGTTVPSAADDLERQALAEVRGYQKTMEARTREAFPDERDAIRICAEGLASGGSTFVSALAKVTRATEMRLRGLLGSATRTAEAQQQASEAARAAALAQMQADQTVIRKALVADVLAARKEDLDADRREQRWKALGFAALGCLLLSAAVGSAGYALGRSHGTLDVAGNLESLGKTADALKGDLAALNDARGGLTILRMMASLPPLELQAAQSIIAELSSAVAGRRTSALVATYELMALSPEQRRDVAEFAKIQDAGLRSNMLAITQTIAARNALPWWEGENTVKGCLANGPVFQGAGGRSQPTCLLPIPTHWPAGSDANLRAWYTPRR